MVQQYCFERGHTTSSIQRGCRTSSSQRSRSTSSNQRGRLTSSNQRGSTASSINHSGKPKTSSMGTPLSIKHGGTTSSSGYGGISMSIAAQTSSRMAAYFQHREWLIPSGIKQGGTTLNFRHCNSPSSIAHLRTSSHTSKHSGSLSISDDEGIPSSIEHGNTTSSIATHFRAWDLMAYLQSSSLTVQL